MATLTIFEINSKSMRVELKWSRDGIKNHAIVNVVAYHNYLQRWYHLADFHVDAAVVLPDVEVEVLVVDAQVPALGQLALESEQTTLYTITYDYLVTNFLSVGWEASSKFINDVTELLVIVHLFFLFVFLFSCNAIM